jgi:curved DNA-binding protein CbpA
MPRDIDYYALLGVDREATEAEIRERFRSLARETHPDRVPSWRRGKAESDFQEIAQAVNVLTNPERRKAYDFELSMAKAAGDMGETDSVVRDYIAQGIALYKEKRYAEAAGNFSLAIRRDSSDARAHHYLGLAAARAGDVRGAVRALEAAISLDPQNSRLLADAGAVFRQAGLLVKAEKAYQEAMRWDPTASDLRRALEEVREQRAVKERTL